MAVAKFSKGGGEEVLNLAPPIKTGKDEDTLRKINALIRFHFKVDPDLLTDYQFSDLWHQLRYALSFEGRRLSATEAGQQIHL